MSNHNVGGCRTGSGMDTRPKWIDASSKGRHDLRLLPRPAPHWDLEPALAPACRRSIVTAIPPNSANVQTHHFPRKRSMRLAVRCQFDNAPKFERRALLHDKRRAIWSVISATARSRTSLADVRPSRNSDRSTTSEPCTSIHGSKGGLSISRQSWRSKSCPRSTPPHCLDIRSLSGSAAASLPRPPCLWRIVGRNLRRPQRYQMAALVPIAPNR